MRVISFAVTTAQFLDGSKDVTRRLGWQALRVGERLRVVRKAMGLRRGERQQVLGIVEVTAVSREPIGMITAAECAREGFPELSPGAFVELFCAVNRGCTPDTVVTRIEFRRVPD